MNLYEKNCLRGPSLPPLLVWLAPSPPPPQESRVLAMLCFFVAYSKIILPRNVILCLFLRLEVGTKNIYIKEEIEEYDDK